MLEVRSKMFFDRSKVLKRLSAKRTKVLSGTGAFARVAMQRSMRYRTAKGKPSKPGTPPKANREYPYIRQYIFFGLGGDDSVAIGPRATSRRNVGNAIPRLLNEGGTAKVVLPGGRTELGKYLPRPFATSESPAGKAGQKKFLELTEKTPL